MSASSGEHRKVEAMLEEAYAAHIIEEQDRDQRKENSRVQSWKRKVKLRKKYVNDEPINDAEYLYLKEQYDMSDDEGGEWDIAPTAKELVWVLGKLIFCMLVHLILIYLESGVLYPIYILAHIFIPIRVLFFARRWFKSYRTTL